MGLDTLLDNTDRSCKHIIMYDEQNAPIYPQNHNKYYKVKVNPSMFYSCHRVPNLSQFAPRQAVFELTAILRQIHRMTPKWSWTPTKGQRYPIYMLQLPTSPKFLSMSLHGYLFSSYENFDRCTVQGTPYTFYTYPQVLTFTSFRSTASRFRVTVSFGTSAPNDLILTLKTKRSKVTHILVTINPESQISLHFALRYCHFLVTGNFKASAANDPQITLSTKRLKVPLVHVTSTPESQISLRFTLPPSVEPCWDKCTEWPQNDLEH